MRQLERFAYGAAGVVSPEVIRWYKIALHPTNADLPSSWPIYLTISVLFVALGGIFATALEDNNRFKCFYLGATFPLFVAAILKAA